jgi:sortase (surface protein transpeptidase)
LKEYGDSSAPEANTPADEAAMDNLAKVPAPGKKKPTTLGIGILEISKINVRMPVLEGASNANLSVGAAQHCNCSASQLQVWTHV